MKNQLKQIAYFAIKKGANFSLIRSTVNQRNYVIFMSYECIFVRINYARELLDSEKQIKENNNLELIDNYLLENDLQEPAAEIQIAAELIDNYLLDKRFMRELEDRDEYDAA